MNFYKDIKKEQPIEPKFDCQKENQYRLIEKYILLYQKQKSTEEFDIDSLQNSYSFKIFKKEYERRINCNVCSFLSKDENKIIFDVLIDLEEIFTSFKRDDIVMKRQLAFYSMKDKKVNSVNNNSNHKEKNLLYIVEMFSKYRLGMISYEQLVTSSSYINYAHSFEKQNGQKSILIQHDKCTILSDLIKLLEENIIGNDLKRSFVK
jgi:hypothetical protein